MRKVFIAFFLLVLISGCSSYVTRYFFTLEVDKKIIQLAQNNDNVNEFVCKDVIYARYKHSFEDEDIKLYLDCEPNGIGIYLSNKSYSPLSIIWDSVKIYSEYMNDTLSITHTNKSQEGIKILDSVASDFNEKSIIAKFRIEDSLSVIKPSFVLPSKTWMDEIIPIGNKYLLPYYSSNRATLNENSNKGIGKSISLKLVLKINNINKNYRFIFQAKDYQIISRG